MRVHPSFPLASPDAPLQDTHGRVVRYLRLSVTDRCNLRCRYCRSGMETFIPHESILRYEEMEALVDLGVRMGIEKVRLTGGEPFARKGFLEFVERLRRAHPALDIRITTNGTLLAPAIPALKALNLNAINLSLDSFDRQRFARITGRDLLPRVLEAIDLVLEAGIPLKINAVAMRGVNDMDLPAFLEFAMRHPVAVRFIEFMPMGEGTRWSEAAFWSANSILDAARKLYTVTPYQAEMPSSAPAKLYTLSPLLTDTVSGEGAPSQQSQGFLGLITPLSNHFCAACNRLRITSDGALRTCLFDDHEYRLRNALRHPRLGLPAVQRIMTLATRTKPVGARLLEQRHHAVALRRMTAIGG